VLVKESFPAAPDRTPVCTNVNGTVFFLASQPALGYELWKTDGTEAGAVLVVPSPGGTSSSPGRSRT
jgi:ELWxxDGT repeat protein